MAIMGRAAREAARTAINCCHIPPDTYSDAAYIVRELATYCDAALDTADALADMARMLCDAWEMAAELDYLDCNRIDAAAKLMRADLAAFDGPGAPGVTRAELEAALREFSDAMPWEWDRQTQPLRTANAKAIALFARLDAEATGKRG